MVNFDQSELNIGVVPVQHLLILCCFGGVPFIDYFASKHSNKIRNLNHVSKRIIDPTDWIATDLPGNFKYFTFNIT